MSLNISVAIQAEDDQIQRVFLHPNSDGFTYQFTGSPSPWLIHQIDNFLKNYSQGLQRTRISCKFSKCGLAWEGLSPFIKKVLNALLTIPFGETRTYGEIAKQIGQPKAARAVGGALGKNLFPLLLPCHRIVASSSIGGFSEGIDLKKKLLDFEARSCKLLHSAL